jgi:hypothetical protein
MDKQEIQLENFETSAAVSEIIMKEEEDLPLEVFLNFFRNDSYVPN